MKIVSIARDSFIESSPFNWGLSLFSFGCNLQCSFCKGYNYETVTNQDNIIGDVIDILEVEVNPCHDCVIFIGGEPTIWGDSLISALEWCHKHNKKTKIFSNGYNYELISKINSLGLCDAWSIDFKGTRENVGSYIGVNGDMYYSLVKKSIYDIINYNLPLEIRTTYFVDNIKDKDKIRVEIQKIEKYMKDNNFSSYYKYFEQDDFRDKIQRRIKDGKNKF